MIIHSNPLFTVYFGSKADGISALHYQKVLSHHSLEDPVFENIKHHVHAQQLFFLRQVHGTDGLVVTQDTVDSIKPFTMNGDFLITKSKIGVGILTADCLPIVIYDSFHTALAVIHAGWRGSVQAIVLATLERMIQEHGTRIEHVRVLFGPSAKVCCYQVSDDFVQQLYEATSFAQEVIVQRGNEYYFNLPQLNALQLYDLGLKKEAIGLKYTLCTICHETFNSYRRQGGESGRQITVAVLK